MRSARPVFEERLRKDTSNGSDLSGFTIKFTFAAQPPEGVNAVQLQAAAAVNQVVEGIGILGSTPAAVDLLALAAGTGTTVVTEVQTFETTWGVLVKRLELFNKIVTNIATVIGFHSLPSLAHRVNLADPSVHVTGLVCYISREQSTSVPRKWCCP